MVRAGIALYGLHPGPLAPVPADFKPALSWKTRVVRVKRLAAGSVVGYGNTYHTHALQQIALIPVGYADGFRRAPKRWRRVLIRGEFAPLVGPVSMNLTAVDVTNIEGVQTGDEVVDLGEADGSYLVVVGALQIWTRVEPWAVTLHLSLASLIWGLLWGATLFGWYYARSAELPVADGAPIDEVHAAAAPADAAGATTSHAVSMREKVKAYIALKLKEVFGLEDINELPISYDIAWYEQKAVVVLLALLALGVKHIRLGPTLPAFLSPNVAKVLVENFDIKPIGAVEADVAAIMAGA